MNPYQNLTDHDLVEALLTGDEAVFDTLYRRYAKPLYSYARKNLPIKEECQEILQDVFTVLWSKRDTLKNVTNLKAYLYKMVTNRIIRYFEHKKVKQRYADHFKAFEILYDHSAVEERHIEELQEKLNKSLASLPERCRSVVKLRISENLSNGDIAKRMNINKSTVKRYMTFALNYFREMHPPLSKSKQRYLSEK